MPGGAETVVNKPRAVVVGASGYIGTNLVRRLVEAGWQVRATSRNVDVLAARNWQGVECLEADVLHEPSLRTPLAGADVAFYLVHCMAAGGDFASLERKGAGNFVTAANAAGLRRIVYLGGLAPENPASQHLEARVETGEILRSADCEVVEIRAGMIVGPGSAAWEVIRDLVNHLPLMVTPRWVRSRSSPIALDNLLTYLIGLADAPLQGNPIYDVAGADVCTYEDMMLTYGELVGKRPVIIDVPVLTPKLSGYWLRLITSVPTNIARALIEGLAHDFLADDAAIRRLIHPTFAHIPGVRRGSNKGTAGRCDRDSLGGGLVRLPQLESAVQLLCQARGRRGTIPGRYRHPLATDSTHWSRR